VLEFGGELLAVDARFGEFRNDLVGIAPSAAMRSPTEPWFSKASNVSSGIVWTVNGAASALM
jgi:hypothetical protein